MTTTELIKNLGFKVFNQGQEKDIENFYIGDLLSWVMGRATENNCWLTVMNNSNVCAVAKLTECACILLCEGVVPDANLSERAKKEGICLLGSDLPLYETAKKITEYIDAR